DQKIVDMMQRRVLHMEEGQIVADEKGGYFKKKKDGKKVDKIETGKKKEKKSEEKVEEAPTEKEEIKEDSKEVEKIDNELTQLGLSQEIAQKLSKAQINNMELLINCTEEDLEKIGITGTMVDEI